MNEIRTPPNIFYKNLKWFKEPKWSLIRPDTVKHLEENIGKILPDINCSEIF